MYKGIAAVLDIIDQVQLAIEDYDDSCGIFLDFSKAFDTVNHQILLTKPDYYGVKSKTTLHQKFFRFVVLPTECLTTVNSCVASSRTHCTGKNT